jgi:hypothetical protein
LAQQNVDLVVTLRAPELMKRTAVSRMTAVTFLAHVRRRLRDEIDELFAKTPQVGGVLRATLLGDRSFVERSESADFQKTGVFHVLVVAGLHVGALAVFLFWMGRALRLAPIWTALMTLTLLLAYVVVEQRPPVICAALMTAIVVIGGLFFRRLDLLNSAGMAALILLLPSRSLLAIRAFNLHFWPSAVSRGWRCRGLRRPCCPMSRLCAAGATSRAMRRTNRGLHNFVWICERLRAGFPRMSRHASVPLLEKRWHAGSAYRYACGSC